MPRPSIGDTLRAARHARGWTQAQAGARAGYSASVISRIERGARGVDIATLRQLAAVYGIEPTRLGLASVGDRGTVDESGDDVLQRRQFLAGAGLGVPFWTLTNLDDALAALPEPASRPAAAAVAARLARGRELFDAGNHTQLIAGLPDLLAAAHQLAERVDPRNYIMVADIYNLATHALNKIGYRSASRLTADRAMTYARLSGSPIAVALSARALSIVLRHEGRPHVAQKVNLAAAAEVEATGLITCEQRTVYVQMLCSTAYAAAQSGDRDRALELTAEADRAMRGLPQQRTHLATPVNATALTTTQVQLYKVGMHWALGDSAAALEAARGLRPAQFPTPERRGRLCTDIARAWWQHGRPDQTAHALLAAHRHAPAEVLARPAIQAMATELVNQHPHVAGARELRAILRPVG